MTSDAASFDELPYDPNTHMFFCDCGSILQQYDRVVIAGASVHYYACGQHHMWARDSVSGRWLKDGTPLRG